MILLALSVSTQPGCGDAAGSGGALPLTDINRADEAVKLDGMVLHDVCGEKPQSECQSCIEHAASVQDECRSQCNLAASVTGNYAFSCAPSCSETSPRELCDYACDPQTDEPECEQRAYSFELTTPARAANVTACEAAVQRDAECGQSTVPPECDFFARVESREVIPVYECLGELACGTEPEVCFAKLPEGTLVERLTAACETPLSASLVEFLKAYEQWIRLDLQDNALICAERYCGTDGYESCLVAWSLAVFAEN